MRGMVLQRKRWEVLYFEEKGGVDVGQGQPIDILHSECWSNEGRTEAQKAVIFLFLQTPAIIPRDPNFHLNTSFNH